MTLKFIIRNITDLEIEFLGDTDKLEQVRGVLSSSCKIQDGKSIDRDNKDNPIVYPAFKMSLYNLYHQSNEQSIAQMILKVIDEKKINISFRNRYLLQYWDFEVKMIVNGQSIHKSFNSEKPPHLSSPILLNAILDECDKKKYLPGFEQLFQLFEQSKKMENNYLNPYLYSSNSFKLNKKEVQKFIKQNENNLFINNETKSQKKYQLLLFDRKLVKIDTDYLPKEEKIFSM
ncbi:hypothetical protein ACNVED_08020 [Legionella sp. D16C41]|uniref:hypothetical protein n=1 Tax=Legionella sp. D16C41 TaxID=3402688 RepID=UPI003AF94AE0